MTGSDRALYVVSTRVVLIAVGTVVVVTALIAALVSWLLVHRLIRVTPAGTRVIERVETVRGDDPFPRVAEQLGGGVIGVYDAHGAVAGSGMILTADGLAAVPLTEGVPSRGVPVLLPDGKEETAQRVREYPEKGLLILRVPGTFPAPRLATEEKILPGTSGVAVARDSSVGNVSVYRTALTTVMSGIRVGSGSPLGVELSGTLTPQLPRTASGAPVAAADGAVLGIVVGNADGADRVLLAKDIDEVLQDVLHNPHGDRVLLLEGLRGTWVSRSEPSIPAIPGTQALRVVTVAPGSSAEATGLRENDLVTGIEGKAFPSAGQLWGRALDAARNNKSITLLVHRGAQDITVLWQPQVTE